MGLGAGESVLLGGVRVPTAPPARVLNRRRGTEGGDRVGPGFESELTHPRLALPREGGGVEAVVEEGENIRPRLAMQKRGGRRRLHGRGGVESKEKEIVSSE